MHNLYQKTFLCLLLLLSILGTGQAQYLTQIGLKDSVYSEILKESRQFFVQFPEEFDPQSNKQYPVAFILDGEILFPAVTFDVKVCFSRTTL